MSQAPPRPENLARSVLHVGAAAAALVLLVFVPRVELAWLAGAMAVGCWGLEVSRRRYASVNGILMRRLGRFAHPHEHVSVNSGTWYATALAILAVCVPAWAAAAAIGVLGVGDPAAGTVGRRWGRTRLAQGRSLEGSLAFAVCGALAAGWALQVGWPEIPRVTAWTIATGAAVVGATTEVVVRAVDDNLSVPVMAAAAAWAMMMIVEGARWVG
jgi:dolichol kinase